MIELNIGNHQFIEKQGVIIPQVGDAAVVSPEGATYNIENPMQIQMLSFRQKFTEGIASKDPKVIKALEVDLQKMLVDPQAAQAGEQVIKENLDKKVMIPADGESNPLILSGQMQSKLEQSEVLTEQRENSGEIKIDDVITSLETYKNALEEVREIADTIELSEQEDTESSVLKTTQDANVDKIKQEIIQNALNDLKQDPMVATLINMISPEPVVLGSFITVLSIIKGNKERTSEGKEVTISTTQFIMLSFLFG